MEKIRFITFFIGLTSVLLSSLAQAQVSADLRLQGETLNFEVQGQKNWDYEIDRKTEGKQTKVQLSIKNINPESLKAIKNIENPYVQSVKIFPQKVDSATVIEFTLKKNSVEAFDYLTDQPSKLILDFYFNSSTAQDDEVQKTKSKAVVGSKKAKVVSKNGQNAKSRMPADVDFLKVSDEGGIPVDIDAIDLHTGLFDGSDDRFKRFKISEHEVNQKAILKGLTNYYLHFPPADQEFSFWKKMKENRPGYEIIKNETDENKQARLLQHLFEKQRPLVLEKTMKWFEKKYPESRYLENAYFMTADCFLNAWEKDHSQTESFEKSQFYYQAALMKYPKSALAERTALSMGFQNIEKQDYLTATRRFNTFVQNVDYKKNLSHQYAQLGLAYSLARLNKFDEANALFDEIEKNSTHPLLQAEAAFRKGEFALQQGEYAEAVKIYNRSFEKYKSFAVLFPGAYFNRMESLFQERKPLEAHKAALDFVQNFPASDYAPYTLTRLGEILEILGADQTKSTGAYLETHFRYGDNPKTIVARLHLLSVRMKGMKDQELKETIQKMNELTSKSDLENIDQFKTTMIADGYSRRNEFNEAIDILTSFYQQSPNRKNSDQVTGRIVRAINDQIHYFSEIDQNKNVLATFQKYHDVWLKNQNRIDTEYFVGKAYQAAGDFKTALKYYNSVEDHLSNLKEDETSLFIKANQTLPLIQDVNLVQAQSLFESGDFQKASTLLQKIKNPEALSAKGQINRVYLAAQIYEKKEDLTSAIRYLNEIVKIWQNEPSLIAPSALKLAELNMKRKNYPKASEVLQQLLSQKVDDISQVKSYKLLAESALKEKNPQVAGEALATLLDKFEKKFPLAEQRYKLGQIFYSQGELKKAENAWSQFHGDEGDFWNKLAQDKMKTSQWKNEYRKYLKRIPASTQQGVGEFNEFFRMEKISPIRKQKILELIDFNLNVIKLMSQLQKLTASEKAKEKLLQYAWPGEEKELEMVLEKAATKCKNGLIEPEDVEINLEKKDLEFPVGLRLENVEREYILQTLYFVQQNRTKAAEILGISIRTLRNKLNQYRMEGHL